MYMLYLLEAHQEWQESQIMPSWLVLTGKYCAWRAPSKPKKSTHATVWGWWTQVGEQKKDVCDGTMMIS